MYDVYEDLSRSVMCDSQLKNVGKTLCIPHCPRLIISIFNVPTSALVDTGSQVTCISEQYYKYISLHGKFTELPVSGVSLFTAVGRRPTTIKKQISLEVEIGNIRLPTNFLVVPGLSNQIILGNDWLLRNGVRVDYKEFSVYIDDFPVLQRLVTFDRTSFDKMCISGEDDMAYIQTLEQVNTDCLNGDLPVDRVGACRSRSSVFLACNDTNQDDVFSCNEFLSDDVSELNCLSRFFSLDNFGMTDHMIDRNSVSIENENKHFCAGLAHGEMSLAFSEDLPLDDIVCGNIIFENDMKSSDAEYQYLEALEASQVADVDDDLVGCSFLTRVREIAHTLTGLSDSHREVFIDMLSKFKKLHTQKNNSANCSPYHLNIKPHKNVRRNNRTVR